MALSIALLLASTFAHICNAAGPVLTGPIKISPELIRSLPGYLKDLPTELLSQVPPDVIRAFPRDGGRITPELINRIPRPVAARLNTGVLNWSKNLTALTLNDGPGGARRELAYWTAPDGTAVIDGDVAFGTEAELLAAAGGAGPRPRALERRAHFGSGNKWIGGIVGYRYYDAATAAKLAPHVDEAIRRWRAGAPYLQFNRLPDGRTTRIGEVVIVSGDCGGCWSHLGMRGAGNVLQLQTPTAQCPGWCYADEATHEFGHLFGLLHEQQRPDRDAYVEYHCENLDPKCDNNYVMPPGHTCCNPIQGKGCCKAANQFSKKGGDNAGDYDYESVMHYRADAFAISGTQTLVSKTAQPVPALNLGNPSIRDFNKMCKQYYTVCKAPDPSGPPPPPGNPWECGAMGEGGCPTGCSMLTVLPKTMKKCRGDWDGEVPPDCDAGYVKDHNARCKAQQELCRTKGAFCV